MHDIAEIMQHSPCFPSDAMDDVSFNTPLEMVHHPRLVMHHQKRARGKRRANNA